MAEQARRPRRGSLLNWLIAIVAVIVVIVGVVIYLSMQAAPVSGFSRDERPIVPEIGDGFDDVHRVVIDGVNDDVALVRRNSGWGVEEFDGYPAVPENVEALLAELTELEGVYINDNAEPEHRRFGVDRSQLTAQGGVVSLFDADGEIIAEVIIGNSLALPGTAENRDRVYVRRAASPDVWIADRELRLTSAPLGWVEQPLFAIPATDIEQVTTVGRNEENRLVVGRDEEGQPQIVEGAVDDSDEEEDDPLAVSVLFSALEDFRFIEARRADEDIEVVAEARFELVDGGTIVIGMREREDPNDPEEGNWALISLEDDAPQPLEAYGGNIEDWLFSLPPRLASRLRMRPEDLETEGGAQTGDSAPVDIPEPGEPPTPGTGEDDALTIPDDETTAPDEATTTPDDGGATPDADVAPEAETEQDSP